MSLTAKMRISNVQTNDGGNPDNTQKVLTGTAVCGEENKPWSQYTPAGSLMLNVTNEDAFASIDAMAGKTVLVTIEVVDE